jgi:hypothetical protein
LGDPFGFPQTPVKLGDPFGFPQTPSFTLLPLAVFPSYCSHSGC